MITIGIPLERAVGAEISNSSEEQKAARGDLWKRPRYEPLGGYERGEDTFFPIFREECRKLGKEPLNIPPQFRDS